MFRLDIVIKPNVMVNGLKGKEKVEPVQIGSQVIYHRTIICDKQQSNPPWLNKCLVVRIDPKKGLCRPIVVGTWQRGRLAAVKEDLQVSLGA